MTATVKIRWRSQYSTNSTMPTKAAVLGYLQQTIGQYPDKFWEGPGWRVRIREWKMKGGRLLPDLVMVESSAGMCYLVDIDDPAHATVVALKFGF